MKQLENIKAILFDSGRVLNGPVTGHWFVTPNFWDYVNKDVFDNIDKSKVSEAFRKADEYIVSQKLIKTKEEEYNHFIKFYQIFSEQLPELELTDDMILRISNDLVFNPCKYAFYDDAISVIPILKEKYRLAIVSDAWPSLLDVYRENDLLSYFDSIVISSILGTSKPDCKMYQTALDELKIKPEEAIFIDDSYKNCCGAMSLGIKTILLCRDKRRYVIEKVRSIGKDYTAIYDLRQLLKML